MATEQLTMEQNWDGVQGKLIEDFIKQELQKRALSKNSLSNLEFEKDEHQSDKVNYTLTFADGSKTSSSFQLSVPSTETIWLSGFETDKNDKGKYTRFVNPGSPLSVSYSFYVKNDSGAQIAGKSPEVTFTIKNNSSVETYTFNPNKPSWQNAHRSVTTEIPAKYIKEGVNEITIKLSYSSGNQVANMEIDSSSDNEVHNTIKVASFKPTLNSKITFNSIDAFAQLLSDQVKDLTYNCALKDSVGRTIDKSVSNYADLIQTQEIIVVKADGGYFTITGSTLNIGQLGNADGVYSFDIYMKLVMVDGTVINSTMDRYQLLTAPGGIIPEKTRYSFKMTDVNATDLVTHLKSDYPYTITRNQYTKLSIPLYATGNNATFTYTVNEEVIKTMTAERNESLMNLSLNDYQLIDNKPITIAVSGGGADYALTVNITSVSASLSFPQDYDFYLNSNGKSGMSPEWSSKDVTTSFSNFDWSSSGWDNGLKVTNGATAVINYKPFKNVLGAGGRTLSFRFKTSNENFDEVLIKSVGNNTDGFEIYPQKAILYKAGSQVETTFTSENSYKEVTFVWYTSEYGDLSIIYVNGTSQAVLVSKSSTAHSQNIVISANNTILYLDKATAYQRALSFYEIQALYINNVGEGVGDYIVENSIFSDNITIGNNGNKVTPDSLPIGSTYLLIKAFNSGESTNVQKPWELINSLPATVNGIETKSWRIIAGNTYLITKTENGLGHPDNFYADRIALSAQGTSSMNYPVKNFRIYFKKKITNPVDTGGVPGFGDQYNADGGKGVAAQTKVFVQGEEVINTNYTPQAGSKAVYQINSGSIPANVFCLKADFAESSGVHNTGFARMANYVMENTGLIDEKLRGKESIQLPQNEYKNSGDKYDVRSTIDGRPIYLFFEGLNGEIVYHGKYNFNNEKASEDVFGFAPYSDTQGYFANRDVQNAAVDLQSAFTASGKAFNLEHYKNTHFTYTSNEVEYVNPIECWEFSTNDSTDIVHRELFNDVNLAKIGAFTFPYVYEDGQILQNFPYSNVTAYTQAKLNPFTETVKHTGKLAWLNTEQAWEYRFPELEDDADELYSKGIAVPYLLRNLYKWVHQHNVYCWNTTNQKAQHAEIFARDLHLYFNIHYLLKYYVLTKWFINADQRIKNCMLSFYCDPAVESNLGIGNNYPMGKMRAYYIFYDNDTILGVTNTGELSNGWDSKETGDVFQGIDANTNISYHGIWGNLEYCYNQYIAGNTDATNTYELGRLIDKTYACLRGKLTDVALAVFLDGDLTKFTKDELTSVSSYIQGNLPDSADNIDAEVKYFFTTGINPGSGSDFASLEKFQGNRKYHREWLLNKRTKWFDAKYGAGSILDYFLSFKLAAAQGTLPSGKIKITPAFDEWRFYLKQGDAGTYTSTKLLNANEEGVLEIKSYINSNVNQILGLYGARILDLSEFYGTINDYLISVYDGKSSLPLPHLTKCILGNPNTSNKLHIGTNTNYLELILQPMINLEHCILNNVIPVGSNGVLDRFSELDMSSFARIHTLDLQNTPINTIKCPLGSVLQVVQLHNPVQLVMYGNINVKTFTIANSSDLNKITAYNCSDVIYKQLTKVWLDKSNIDSGDILDIKFGSNNDTRDEISKETLANLVQLANKIIANAGLKTNIKVSGNAYCPDLTYDDTNKLYQAFGDALSIVNSDSTEFEFVYDSMDLYENGSVKISSTVKVDEINGVPQWDIEVDNDALKNSIKIESSTAYQCIISASSLNENISRVGTLRVKAVRNGETYTSDDINISYIPITSLKLTTTKQITSSSTIINLDLGQHTKQHLLKPEYINVEVSQGTYSLNVTEGVVKSITYNISNDDVQMFVSCHGLTSNIFIYYDKPIYTKQEIESDKTLSWLNQLLAFSWNAIGQDTVYRSTFMNTSKIPVLTTNAGVFQCGEAKVDLSTEETPQNLTAVQYFNVSGYNKFTIPSFKFTSLSIPENIQQITWNGTIDSFTGYETITIPSTTIQVDVQLTLSVIPTKLCFDLTKAKQIKQIYNAGSAKNNVFNLNLTVVNSSAQCSNNILFIYHDGIEQIGQFSENIANTDSIPGYGAAMFNIEGLGYTTSSAQSPLYQLGALIPKGTLNIGCVSSYKLSDSAFNWADESFTQRITGLYYTFYKDSGYPSGTELVFTNMKVIGNGSFTDATCKITFGNNKITKVGSNAFSGFKSNSGDMTFTQSEAKQLGEAAFTRSCINIYHLKDVTSIGSLCFNNEEKSYTINIEQNLPIQNIGSYAFGSNKIHNLYLTTNNEQVKTTFLNYKNDVNLYINNALQS